MALSPQAVASKWARRAAAASQDLQNGVNAVTVAPSSLAIAKKQKAIANYLQAMNDGTWERNLGAVTLADWKKAMIEKGVTRYAQGVQAAEPKMAAFMADLLPFQANLSQQVSQMPDLTLEDSLARMTAFVRGMANFRK